MKSPPTSDPECGRAGRATRVILRDAHVEACVGSAHITQDQLGASRAVRDNTHAVLVLLHLGVVPLPDVRQGIGSQL